MSRDDRLRRGTEFSGYQDENLDGGVEDLDFAEVYERANSQQFRQMGPELPAVFTFREPVARDENQPAAGAHQLDGPGIEVDEDVRRALVDGGEHRREIGLQGADLLLAHVGRVGDYDVEAAAGGEDLGEGDAPVDGALGRGDSSECVSQVALDGLDAVSQVVFGGAYGFEHVLGLETPQAGGGDLVVE